MSESEPRWSDSVRRAKQVGLCLAFTVIGALGAGLLLRSAPSAAPSGASLPRSADVSVSRRELAELRSAVRALERKSAALAGEVASARAALAQPPVRRSDEGGDPSASVNPASAEPQDAESELEHQRDLVDDRPPQPDVVQLSHPQLSPPSNKRLLERRG